MAEPKDVFSLNELSSLRWQLQGFNDHLIEAEESEVVVSAVCVVVRDSRGSLIGSFTKYSRNEDLKFEPNFEPDFMV